MNKTDRRIIKVLIAMTLMFISLVIYLSYFQIFRAASVAENSYNKRLFLNEQNILRGSISDRIGTILAYSEKRSNTQERYYPYENLYCHVIGYSNPQYGKSGLEASYNSQLLNISQNPLQAITQKIKGPNEKGNNLILTIDNDLQRKAERYLRGKKGSIIMMNPKTGEIYAMVSKPDFNPLALNDNWVDIAEDKDSPLLNRSTMGLYTPGSVFKIITATAAIENNLNPTYDCTGSININGYQLNDYKGTAHGTVDLEKAFEVSCNTAFASMGLSLGDTILKETAQKYLLNQKIPFDLTTKMSIFPKGSMSNSELGATAIGQGKILVTPLNMLLAASAIANDGKIMKPYLVKEITSPQGKIIDETAPQILQTAIDPPTASIIKDMMVNVVKKGTGKSAWIRNIDVAGKTGTAENSTDKEHAWFVAFAPAEDPRVAVVVILENSGTTGGKSAAPIARSMIINALDRIQ